MNSEITNYRTDIDYDSIKDASHENLIKYIEENFTEVNNDEHKAFTNTIYQRSVFMNVVAKMCKLDLSPEQWIFLLTESHRSLCEACAGAGKTTVSQLKLVDLKQNAGIPGKYMLSLAYNHHAVEDMISRHRQVISRINSIFVKIAGKNEEIKHLDTELCCFTFHAWCRTWVKEFQTELKINVDTAVLKDEEQTMMMSTALSAFCKMFDRKIYGEDSKVKALLSLYSFACETDTLKDPEIWSMSSSYGDLEQEFTTQEMTEIFNRYRLGKKIRKKIDFQDMIILMYNICCDPVKNARIRSNYRVFLIDEYQDITPSMLKIIKVLLEGDESLGIPRYDDGYLICIGDGDQSVYGFRGTDPLNCVRFRDVYCGSTGFATNSVKVVSMSINRRCCKEVLDRARVIIESNDNRIEKPINGLDKHGKVGVIEYDLKEHECSDLVDKLKLMSLDEMSNSCIAYRNLSSSRYLCMTLLEQGIPFRKGNFLPLFSDIFTKNIECALHLLTSPMNTYYMKNALFKLLPRSTKLDKKALSDLIDAEDVSREAGGDMKEFWAIFGPEWFEINGFREALSKLYRCWEHHRANKTMNSYVPVVLKLLNDYYLNWQLQQGADIDAEYMNKMKQWYTRAITYDDFLTESKLLKDKLDDNSRDNTGVCVTTFHGLKGLEFDNVFVIDMQDQLFPGIELSMNKSLSPEQKEQIEKESRRLLYVAVTRARTKLTLYFNKDMPSRYIRYFTDTPALVQEYQKLCSDPEQEFIFEQAKLEEQREGSADEITSSDGFADLFGNSGEQTSVFADKDFPAFEDEVAGEFSDEFQFAKSDQPDNELLIQEIGTDNMQMLKEKPHTRDLLSYVIGTVNSTDKP